MKCRFCGNEWMTTDKKIHAITCPFCGRNMLPGEKELDSLQKVLDAIAQLFGVDVFDDEQKLLAYFSDLAPGSIKERRLLSYLVECNGHAILLKARTEDKDEQQKKINQVVSSMEENAMVTEQKAREICDAFWIAIGGNPAVLPAVKQKTHREATLQSLGSRRKWNSIVHYAPIGIAIMIVLLLVVSGIVGLFTGPQRTIARESKEQLKQAEQMIDTGDYEAAIAILDQINTEWKDYSMTESVRQKAERGLLMEQINAYQTAGDYEGLVKFIDDNFSSPGADTEIQVIYEEATQKCKEDILITIAAYADTADYLGAVEYIDCLGTSMKNDAEIQIAYNQAVAGYKAEVLAAAENYAQASDYTSARSALSVAENYIGSDEDLANKISEINEREVTAKVLTYVDAGNYKDAILCLNENSAVVSGSADLQTKLSTYTEKYREVVLADAVDAYRAKGYESAVSVLTDALKMLKNDAILTKEKEKYAGLAPVSLLDIRLFYDGHEEEYGATRYDGVSLEDKLGNTYTNAILYLWDGGDGCEDVYLVNGGYTRFTATLFVPSQRESGYDDDGYYDLDLRIYGDGKLLYTSPRMDSRRYPVNIEINISDVEQLSIVCDTAGAPGMIDGSIGLGDMYLWKD